MSVVKNYYKLINSLLKNDLARKIYSSSSILQKLNQQAKRQAFKLSRTSVDSQLYEKMKIDNFLPPPRTSVAHAATQRIKIRISYGDLPNVWNSLQPIVSAFCQDEAYDVLVLIGQFASTAAGIEVINRKVSQCEAIGVPYIIVSSEDSYSPEADRPDIFILNHYLNDSLPNPLCTRICDASRLSALIYKLEKIYGGGSRSELIAFHRGQIADTIKRFHLDYVILAEPIYNAVAGNDFFPSKLVCMGGLPYDSVFHSVQSSRVNPAWPKLVGKKTIFYCSSHGFTYNGATALFVDYAPLLLRYAWEHENIGLIIRPHPELIYEILQWRYWSENDLAQLKSLISQSPNIVWDERDTYNDSMAQCDALLTDHWCGVVYPSLALGVPVGTLYSENGKVKQNIDPEALSATYKIQSPQQLYDFLEMVARNEDPMKDSRAATTKSLILHFDGKNAQRIKDFLIDKLREVS